MKQTQKSRNQADAKTFKRYQRWTARKTKAAKIRRKTRTAREHTAEREGKPRGQRALQLASQLAMSHELA